MYPYLGCSYIADLEGQATYSKVPPKIELLDFGHYGVYQDPIVSRIEQFYLQESSKCLLGQYLKKLSSWEPANSGRRSSDSHSRGAHRYPYLGCSCIADLDGQSDPFKSASVDRIERFWTLWSLPGPHTVQNRSILSTGIIKVPPRAISQKVVKSGTRQLGAALTRFT